MRASILIAAHNEGELLARTVGSCVETTEGLDVEIVVVDDASSDGCAEEAKRRFPFIRVFRHRRRRGCSATKDSAARHARGDVLVFLDGHSKPEKWAIERLVNDVEDTWGRVVVTPAVLSLDAVRWENRHSHVGFGYRVDLKTFGCGWVDRSEMWRQGKFYESPCLCGCCLAVSRKLYNYLLGFDRHMEQWGVEDLDFGLKAWLVGDGILHDPDARIGHRFRERFDNFTVDAMAVPVNQLRAARKNLSDPVWNAWLERFRSEHSPEDWVRIWRRFRKRRRSLEKERRYLFRHRKRDEYWYAARFGLSWPSLA